MVYRHDLCDFIKHKFTIGGTHRCTLEPNAKCIDHMPMLLTFSLPHWPHNVTFLDFKHSEGVENKATNKIKTTIEECHKEK